MILTIIFIFIMEYIVLYNFFY